MDAPILQRIELPERQGSVTLYDWMAADVRDGRNLVRTDQAGDEVWRAKPVLYGEAGNQDCFTRVDWDGTALTADTWSCYRVDVGVNDGLVTVLEFTK
jgi:hypothetical protein